MWLETNPVIQLQMQGENNKNKTTRIKIKSHIMFIVKVQSVALQSWQMSSDEEETSHVIVVEGIHRLRESLFLEVGMSTMGSLPLTKRGALRRPSSQTDCGMQHRSEPRTGRHCLKDPTADSGYLESAEVSSHRLSGPSAALCLTLELGSEPQALLSTGSLGERFCFQNLFSSHHSITCLTLSILNKRTVICKYFHVRIV